MSKIMQTAADVRKFNRFYLPYFHLLAQKYLNSDYSMAEARILYEIFDNERISARDIVNTLRIDKGYLSRMLKRFEMRGLVERKESEEDSRRALIFLTEDGKAVAEKLIAESNMQVEKALAGISDCDLDELSGHFAEIIRILGGKENGNH